MVPNNTNHTNNKPNNNRREPNQNNKTRTTHNTRNHNTEHDTIQEATKMKEEIDIDHYSQVIKKQARNESDQIRDLKRKIEDNTIIKDELTKKEQELLTTSLQREIDNLEQMASKSREFLEKKLDETSP